MPSHRGDCTDQHVSRDVRCCRRKSASASCPLAAAMTSAPSRRSGSVSSSETGCDLMVREPLSVLGGSRYIPAQVGTDTNVSRRMAIARASTSLRYSDTGCRLSLATNLVGVIEPAYWTFGQCECPDAWSRDA